MASLSFSHFETVDGVNAHMAGKVLTAPAQVLAEKAHFRAAQTSGLVDDRHRDHAMELSDARQRYLDGAAFGAPANLDPLQHDIR
jgi:hypothetical protein